MAPKWNILSCLSYPPPYKPQILGGKRRSVPQTQPLGTCWVVRKLICALCLPRLTEHVIRPCMSQIASFTTSHEWHISFISTTKFMLFDLSIALVQLVLAYLHSRLCSFTMLEFLPSFLMQHGQGNLHRHTRYHIVCVPNSSFFVFPLPLIHSACCSPCPLIWFVWVMSVINYRQASCHFYFHLQYEVYTWSYPKYL